MTNDEFQDLIDARCNGTLDDEGVARLEAHLLSSSASRREYRRAMNLHAGLHERAGGDAEFSSVPVSETGSGRWMVPLAAAAAAAVIAVAVTVLAFGGEDDERDSVAVENAGVSSLTAPRAFAVLSGAVDAEWALGSQQPHVGGSFGAGEVGVTSGLLHIDFLCGANVVLEGPARLEIVSDKRGVLHFGKLRASVPEQAIGFTIDTASAQFVDLGTEFGLDCSPGGAAELHVFDGEVEVQDNGAQSDRRQLVRSGAGLRLASGGEWSDIPTDGREFVDAHEIAERALKGIAGRVGRWEAEHRSIAGHPGLIAYYDFEPDSTRARTLRDLGAAGLDGAVVGCNWAEGRWPGKGALEFKQSGDRVRLDVPGEFDSLSMMVWMRIDGFDRQFNSILLSDAFDNGHAHWQVKSDGVIDLGVKPPDATRRIYLTDRQFAMEDLGRWVHLAVVYDTAARSVTHFMDGIPVKTLGLSGGENFPLRLGPSEIGNWSPQSSDLTMPIRNLNGRIDELAIFGVALDAEEIWAHFELGKPY